MKLCECNSCEEQLESLLCDIPIKWRKGIISVICNMQNKRPRHCRIDIAAKLASLPSDWKDELTEVICLAYDNCGVTCEVFDTLTKTLMSSFPEDWRRNILNSIFSILSCKNCVEFCYTYLITPFVGIDTDYEYSYIDCNGNLFVGTLGPSDSAFFCAKKDSIVIDDRFHINFIDDDCHLSTETCYCVTLNNVETETGVVVYKFSYENCNTGVFTDIPLDKQESINICASISSIVTNFAYSITLHKRCVDECF